MTAWAGSSRKQRLPPNWEHLRRQVLERDGYRCRQCGGVDGGLQADHIQPGDNHSLTNLQALCARCHQAKSASEGNDARWNRRPSEPHPGLQPGGAPPTPPTPR